MLHIRQLVICPYCKSRSSTLQASTALAPDINRRAGLSAIQGEFPVGSMMMSRSLALTSPWPLVRTRASPETQCGSAEAHFLRGEALEQLGDTRPAARAYLDSFSSAPTGPQAPNALFKVGTSLAALGQMTEACQMLEQVEVRFPDADVTLDARSSMLSLGCL